MEFPRFKIDAERRCPFVVERTKYLDLVLVERVLDFVVVKNSAEAEGTPNFAIIYP